MNYQKYKCILCDFIYDEAKGDPDSGLKPGTKYADIPEDWECPECGAKKIFFELIGQSVKNSKDKLLIKTATKIDAYD